MKTKKILLSAALIAVSFTTVAQVGVGTTDPKAALDVVSTDSGFIMPRVADHTTLTVGTDQKGMQVYNTTTESIWLYDGTSWVENGVNIFEKIDTNASGTNNAYSFALPNLSTGTARNRYTEGFMISDNGIDNTGFGFFGDMSINQSGSASGVTTLAIKGDNSDFKRIRFLNGPVNGVDNPIETGFDIGVTTGNTRFRIYSYDTSTDAVVEKFGIDRSTGNVGIGNTAAGPSSVGIVADASLTVTGRMDATFDRSIAVRGVNGSLAGYIGTSNEAGAAQKMVINGHRGAGGIIFKVANSSAVLDANGSLGIGTELPKSKLHVVGFAGYATDAAAGAAGLTAGAFYQTVGHATLPNGVVMVKQ